MRTELVGCETGQGETNSFVTVFYIIFLLTQPCQDVLGAPSLTSGDASASQTEEDEDCEDGDDTCPPFCICSCRQAPAGYFSIETAPELKVRVEPIKMSEKDYTRRVSASFTASVWQPPKNDLLAQLRLSGDFER